MNLRWAVGLLAGQMEECLLPPLLPAPPTLGLLPAWFHPSMLYSTAWSAPTDTSMAPRPCFDRSCSLQRVVQGAGPCSLQFQRQPQAEVEAEAQRGFAGGC